MRDDVAAVVYYVLSHCNIEIGKKSVIWIGCMTPVNLKRLKEKPEVTLYKKECPECKAQQIVYLATPDGVGEPEIGYDGQYRWMFYKEKLYRYHIVTWKEKYERREARARERARERASAPPGIRAAAAAGPT